MSSTVQLKTTPARGTRDLLPAEVALRDWATQIIKHTYESFGFTRIETPAIENIDLLKRGEGGENLQLIFEILKRGEKLEAALKEGSELSDLGLRFDLTVPLVRFYANNLNDLPNPFKAIQIGPVWRAESPQKDRYRQFTQCDIDVIGIKSAFAELDLLCATSEALLNLGFDGFTIRLNDRRLLTDLAIHCGFAQDRLDNVFITVDKLDKIGMDGVRKELLNNNHNPDSVDKLIAIYEPVAGIKASGAEQAEKVLALMPENSESSYREELKELIACLSDSSHGNRFSLVLDPTLVRGMGYYTGPIFEVTVPGFAHSVAGGGRYDHMVEKFLDREVSACGFSIGFERIISILQERGIGPGPREKLLALIYDQGRDRLTATMQAMTRLKSQNWAVSLVAKKKDLKKQIDQLAGQGYAAFCVFRGDPEDLQVKELGSN
ncbi:MAG: histidine--tRNA ligase [Cyanobacteria bacterium HKST-UBA02]|nr:histidine--tRNA ligase [Cyanobacteria bacterium HKST-UBA02]